MSESSDFESGIPPAPSDFQAVPPPPAPDFQAAPPPPPPPSTPDFGSTSYTASGDVTPDDRLWAALTYVLAPIGSLVVYLMEDKKARPFIRQHYAQAAILGIINLVLAVALGWLCCGIGNIVFWLFCCYYGYQAYQGQAVNIPLISQFVNDQGWNK